MSDQAVILPKWSSYEGIILAKGQFDHSYPFWTTAYFIFGPVANFGDQSLCNLCFISTVQYHMGEKLNGKKIHLALG